MQPARMKSSNSLAQNPVIPAKAGIQLKNTPRSGQNFDSVPRSRGLLINWIPAFAGMTD
jgi:hypothetical protein